MYIQALHGGIIYNLGYIQCVCVRVFTVVSGDYSHCRGPIRRRLPDVHGMLASISTTKHNYGSAQCPWILKVSPGQQILLELSIFGTSWKNLGDIDDTEYPVHGERCDWLIMVTEPTSKHQEGLCQPTLRNKEFYKSDSNELEVAFDLRGDAESAPTFAVHYTGNSPYA